MCKCPLYRALRSWPFVKLDFIIALGIVMPLGCGIPQRHAHFWLMPVPRSHPTCNTWQLICMVCTLNFIALDVSLPIFSFKLAHKTKLSDVLGGAFWKPNEGFLKVSFFVPFYARSLSIVNQCKPLKYGGWKWTNKFDGQNSLNCIRKYWWIIVASLNDLTCMKPTPENEMNF